MRSICKLRNSSSIIIHYIIIQSNSCIKYHSYFQNYEPQKTFIFQWRDFNSIRKFTHDYAEIFHDFNTIFSLSISPLSLSRLSLILTEITITFQAIKHFWLADISWLYNFIRDTNIDLYSAMQTNVQDRVHTFQMAKMNKENKWNRGAPQCSRGAPQCSRGAPQCSRGAPQCSDTVSLYMISDIRSYHMKSWSLIMTWSCASLLAQT